VHYLEGQKAAAQQASEASNQHQLLATQVYKNTEQNGKIVSLLRELKDGLKGRSERTEDEMKSCFEFAANVDIDHKKRLEECQNRDYKRHAELREELRSLQDMVYSLVAHVQGSKPLEPAVSEPTQIPAQSQEPADEVSPEMEKLAKEYVKARKRMLMQRNFSEWCKFAYKRKVSKHEWCPKAGGGLVSPAERILYYMEHGTSHGSARARKGKQGGHEVISVGDEPSKGVTLVVPSKRVISAVVAGAVKCCNESCDQPRLEGVCSKSGKPKQACSKECFKAQEARLQARRSSQQQSEKQAPSGNEEEEADMSEDSTLPSSSTSETGSDEDDKWCCNRRFRIEGKGREWRKCMMFNDKDAIECQRCSMPRYDRDEEKDMYVCSAFDGRRTSRQQGSADSSSRDCGTLH
jgi:hypothetical protein